MFRACNKTLPRFGAATCPIKSLYDQMKGTFVNTCRLRVTNLVSMSASAILRSLATRKRRLTVYSDLTDEWATSHPGCRDPGIEPCVLDAHALQASSARLANHAPMLSDLLAIECGPVQVLIATLGAPVYRARL